MIWNVPETIAYLSGLVKLEKGRPDLSLHAGKRRRGRAGDLLKGVVEGAGMCVRTHIV
jgi:hypothetical protein